MHASGATLCTKECVDGNRCDCQVLGLLEKVGGLIQFRLRSVSKDMGTKFRPLPCNNKDPWSLC